MPTRTGRRRVYVGGPISAEIGVSRESKLVRFHNAEAWLRENGLLSKQVSKVVNPLKVGPLCGLRPATAQGCRCDRRKVDRMARSRIPGSATCGLTSPR
jgi:hypothetical protein